MAESRQDMEDRRMMALALRLARKGRTAPNPRVGAVVVREGKVVGKGFHRKAGMPHAEIEALRDAGEQAKGATLYCTLEPCNHFGRTPPCSEAIIAAGISKVFVGCVDPKKHGLPGVLRLRTAGIEVVENLLGEECQELIADFACLSNQQRPLVILKAATTLDGKLGPASKERVALSSPHSQKDAHRLRAECDAILVGTNTAQVDNPSLTVRAVRGPNPLRVVLDRRGELQNKLNVFDREAKTLVYTAIDEEDYRSKIGLPAHVMIHRVGEQDGELSLDDILRDLAQRNVMRLLVEGGSRVHGSFVRKDLADRLVVYQTPILLGDSRATNLAMIGENRAWSERVLLEDLKAKPIGSDLRIDAKFARAKSHETE